jgi:hypothetical protein
MVSGAAYVITGCAVGNFVTGAPSKRSVTANRALLERRCSNCHATPDPGSMSGADWQASLERMKRLMQLPASEWDSLAVMASHEGDH